MQQARQGGRAFRGKSSSTFTGAKDSDPNSTLYSRIEGFHVAIKAVWGFDPDEVAKAQARLRSAAAEGPTSSYRPTEENAARIPPDAESQIYELRRIFSLS
jgi:hypothetical protein